MPANATKLVAMKRHLWVLNNQHAKAPTSASGRDRLWFSITDKSDF